MVRDAEMPGLGGLRRQISYHHAMPAAWMFREFEPVGVELARIVHETGAAPMVGAA